MMVLGLALTRKSSKFTRPEKDGEMVTWYKVELGETDTLSIGNILVGYAEDFVKHFGYNLPERHVKSNGIGMMVNLTEPIMKGDWEIQSYYFTQKNVIYDIIDLMFEVKAKHADASVTIGKGTKADPEKVLEFETWLVKNGLVVSIKHEKGQGNRTRYVATGGQSTLD